MPRFHSRSRSRCVVYIGNLKPQVTERDIEDNFRSFGVFCRIWVARRPPGFGFVEFVHRKDALKAIREMDGINGWKVELAFCSRNGGGRGLGGQVLICNECGQPNHFARECPLRIEQQRNPRRWHPRPYSGRSYRDYGRRVNGANSG